jgi:hypothetical protein
MGRVTESLEIRDTTINPEPAYGERRPNRLNRALAWVGIAAGSLFIVATVFFSGFVLGQQGDGGGGMHHGQHRMMLKPFDRPDGPGPGGPMGPDNGPRAERLTPPSAQPGTPPRP